jgi:hypothetical protein
MVVLQSAFMFCSSMAVFIYIIFGGVVGHDIRTSIRVKDLIFGALLFVLISAYITYLYNFSPIEQWHLYEHIVHIIGNMILLQMLILNRSAMTYWRQILRRWRNNLAPCLRGASVAPRAGVTYSTGGPVASVRIPLVFTITGPQAKSTNSRGESEDLEQRELQDVETNEDCQTVHLADIKLKMIGKVDEVDDLEDRQLSNQLDATSLIDELEIGPKLIFVKPVDVEPVFLPLGSEQFKPSGPRLIRVRPAPGAECEGDVYDETSF